MSHEIRTPMNTIIGMSTLAKENITNPNESLRCINNIESSTRFLLSLINDILNISKIESGKIAIKKETFSFKELIDSINNIISLQAKNKKITYTSSIIGKHNDYYFGDFLKLQQIFINLLGNSVKFTKENGDIDFIIEQYKDCTNKAYFKFTIRDNGIGIKKEFMDKIFIPFEQQSTETTTDYTGSGLGLPICKNLIELMNGDVKVMSSENVGTEFTVRLQLDLSAEDKAINTIKYDKNRYILNNDFDFLGKRILLVEDHPLNIEITKKLLTSKNAIVEVAKNGLIGFETFENNEENYFDLILMDIRMPIMDGLEATRKIRMLDREDAKNIPIIAMSANAFDEDIEKSKLSGINEHLSKPIEPKLFYSIVERYLNI